MYQKLKEERERYQEFDRWGKKECWAYIICGGCYGLCAAYVHVIGGVPVAMESVADSDMGGQGGICGKGSATILDHNDPNRVNLQFPAACSGDDPRNRTFPYDRRNKVKPT